MSAPVTKEASVPEAALREEDVRQALTAELGHIESAVAERLASLRADYEGRLRTRQEQWRRQTEALEQRTRAVEAAAATLAQQIEALMKASMAPPKRPTAERAPEPPQPVSQSRPVVRKSTSLAPWLSDRGFEVIDKRPSGGGLWVLGEPAKLERVFARLKTRGIIFTHAPHGGRATNGRPAWFTKSPK